MAMNSTVISGTPRTELDEDDARTACTTGIFERRPSASRMPSGSDATMPTTATTSVTSRPPHSVGLDDRQARRTPPRSRTNDDDRQHDEEVQRRRGRVRGALEPRAARRRRSASIAKNTSTRQRCVDRIGAVDEIGEPLADEGPAGADRGCAVARQASRSAPSTPRR